MFLINLINSLCEAGNNVIVFDLHPLKSDRRLLARINKHAKYTSSPYERLQYKGRNIGSLNKLLAYLNLKFKLRQWMDDNYIKKLIDRERIEIINSHMYLSDLFIHRSISTLSIPKVTTMHGCYNLLLKKNGNTKAIERLKDLLSVFDEIVYISDNQKEAIDIIKPNVAVKKIYNGLPHAKNIVTTDVNFTNKIENRFVVGMVARGIESKGWEYAIKAVLQLRTSKIILALVGWSEYLKELYERYYTEPNIVFLGHIDEPGPYTGRFDIGILPTYFEAESLPNTVIEYLAYGKPVIATEWAEIPKMLEHEGKFAGTIIDIENGKPNVDQLSKAIHSYFTDNNLYMAHADLARKAFSKFNLDSCRQAYLELFQGLIND